ncbi:hypothetical protein GCM10027275_09420 [Rhabdobacter roseus]|uniref:LysM repeat protein n=1 Tax=Rhabdobacter roseus TaxID=1655419 RepID=A0A840TNR4_9BACT|nr:LysM peptidoglycan-binding domain-containing protein [Rhabdobacter roseus]MBB5282843.1 LysM repeat protein [Rhabdobacter roseus]
MKYTVRLIVILVLFVGIKESVRATSFPVASRDSIGTEKVNGKVYILHKVDQGQTMYAVMRRYKTTIGAIREANPGINDQLRFNDVIRVPYDPPRTDRQQAREERKEQRKAEKENTVAAPAVAKVPDKPVAPGMHRVEAGQTLYGIASKYGVLMADVRKWNNMTSDNVPLGQDLIVSEKTYLERNPVAAAKPPVSVALDSVSTKAKPSVPEKVVKPVEAPAPPRPAVGRKVNESGLAEMIETNESTNKYLALHRTAPIGTLVEVKNEYNQEKLLVKVIGRIPDTSVNEEIVIKLSARAFEKLSPNTRRFRAEINYIAAN